jgi:hypothetical protein
MEERYCFKSVKVGLYDKLQRDASHCSDSKAIAKSDTYQLSLTCIVPASPLLPFHACAGYRHRNEQGLRQAVAPFDAWGTRITETKGLGLCVVVHSLTALLRAPAACIEPAQAWSTPHAWSQHMHGGRAFFS